MNDERAWLDLWERALPLNWPQREQVLARAGSTGPEDGFPSVGAQRRALLQAHRRLAGPLLALRCNCPACTETLSFEADLDHLIDALPDGPEAPGVHELTHGDWLLRFRLPTPHDVGAAPPSTADAFVAHLLQACVLQAAQGGAPRPAHELPASVLDALSARMEALDPAANLQFELACPACGHRWAAGFDAARGLWAVVQMRAERLLLDVDHLARRYGWSEDQVMALSPLRRQAYLQLVSGA